MITHPKRTGRQRVRKIRDRSANEAVLGVGTSACPLALEIASAGFKVVGIDLDQNKTATFNSGKSYIGDAADQLSQSGRTAGYYRRWIFAALRDVDTVSVFVPTPLSKVEIRTFL